MRVISQDGFYDLPYENVALSLNSNNRKQVIAWSASDFCRGDLYSVMGNYSTEEKAKKAMEFLQNTYYEHEAEKIYKEGMNYIHPYFRFPKDEDVEV